MKLSLVKVESSGFCTYASLSFRRLVVQQLGLEPLSDEALPISITALYDVLYL